MAFELRAPFDTQSNYTYPSSMQVANSLLSLNPISNPSQSFVQNYASDTGFTYNNTESEFSGGQVQQKSQMPASGQFVITYQNNEKINYGQQQGTGSLEGGAVITNNSLDCTSSINDRAEYTGLSLPPNAGAIKVKFKPNFSGTPSVNGYLWSTNGTNEMYLVCQSSNGSLRLVVKNDSGTAAIDVSTGAKSWNAGQQYVIFVNWSITGTVGNIYIDDDREANETSFTGTRAGSNDKITVGSFHTGIAGIDGFFEDFIVYNAVQETGASYSSAYTLAETEYVENTVTLPAFTYSGVGNIETIDQITNFGSGSYRWVINDMWWNGVVWHASDGSYAEANDDATFNANIASFTAADTITLKLVFTDTITQSSVTNTELEYTGQIYTTDKPACLINEPFTHDGLTGFVESGTIKPGTDEIKYTITKGTQQYWHDGADWVVSAGNYSQANTATEIETNKATFTTTRVQSQVYVYLYSSDGSTTPSIDLLTVSYDFAGEAADEVETCIVYGYSYDSQGAICTEDITFTLSRSYVKYKDNILICQETLTATPRASDGLYEIELVENENMSPDTQYKVVKNSLTNYISVPNQDDVLLNDLLD